MRLQILEAAGPEVVTDWKMNLIEQLYIRRPDVTWKRDISPAK